MFFTLSIANGTQAQSATNFTATNAQISGTLTSSTRLDANCMHVQDTIHADGGIVSGQDVDIQGNLNLTGNINASPNSTATLGSLITNGPAVFSNSLTLSSMVGNGNYEVLVNSSGQLLKGNKKEAAECVLGAPQWFIGGNNVIPFINNATSGLSAGDIGTCDNTEFVLKANNIRRQWVHPGGSVTFGTLLPSNSGTPEYKFNNGPIRLQGTSNFGGPQIVFDGGQYPYGDWGIEYTTQTSNIGGLNFWKPALSPNSFNNLFFIADNGHIGVGTGNLPSRFNVDAWNGDGIFVKTATILDKVFRSVHGNSIDRVVIYGDGRTKLRPGASPSNVEVALNPILYIQNVGSPSTESPSPYKAGIVVECIGQSSTKPGNYFNSGILVLSDNIDNTNATAYAVHNSNLNKTLFRVNASGKTNIGEEFTSPAAYLLTVNGKIGAREIKVSIQNPWPDYVFNKNYNLLSLNTIESFIQKNHHLPNIPSAKELKSEECGLNLGEMQGLQMEKIEEIYLYLIEMDKQLNALKKENEELKKQLKK